MTDINEVQLPGVGVMHEFITKSGTRVGVISHRTGRKEVVVGDREDPDASRSVLELGEQDARTLAELLGGSRVTEALAELQQKVEGLAIDWLPLSPTPRTPADRSPMPRFGVAPVSRSWRSSAARSPSPRPNRTS